MSSMYVHMYTPRTCSLLILPYSTHALSTVLCVNVHTCYSPNIAPPIPFCWECVHRVFRSGGVEFVCFGPETRSDALIVTQLTSGG